MDIRQEKTWLCILCKEGHIVQTRIEHTSESAAMCDIQNCDFSDYSDYGASGGYLLQKRPDLRWQSAIGIQLEKASKKKPKGAPIGGICDSCLKNPIVLSLMEHIQFENKSR